MRPGARLRAVANRVARVAVRSDAGRAGRWQSGRWTVLPATLVAVAAVGLLVSAPARAALSLQEFTQDTYTALAEGQRTLEVTRAGEERYAEVQAKRPVAEIEAHEVARLGAISGRVGARPRERPAEYAYSQAGGHPFATRSTFVLAASGADEARTLEVALPPGFLGNTQNTPLCQMREMTSSGGCSQDAAVGFVRVREQAGESELYNLVPGYGHPAALGFLFRAGTSTAASPVVAQARVRGGSDFGVTVASSGLPRPTGTGVEVTICDLGVTQLRNESEEEGLSQVQRAALPKHYACAQAPPASWASPFLDAPTRCVEGNDAAAASPRFSGRALGWEDEQNGAEMAVYQNGEAGPGAAPGDQAQGPGAPALGPFPGEAGELLGCGSLTLAPAAKLTPSSAAAGEPAAETIELHLAQPASGFFELQAGTRVGCEAGSWQGVAASALSYQWLRDGLPIEAGAGGTEASYTLGLGDVGMPIQCEALATGASGSASLVVSNATARWGPFAPAPAPPAPGGEAAPTITGATGSAASEGTTLTCNPHASGWAGSPEFTFQWLENGQPISATAPEYTVRGAAGTNIQCEVTAANTAGRVVALSANEPVAPIDLAPESVAGAGPAVHSDVPGGSVPLQPSGLRSATITLPEGLVLSPAAADGLAACSPAQIGLATALPAAETEAPGPIHFSESGLREGEPRCPDASKLGTIEMTIPILNHPLQGSFYLAEPHENPFGSLFAIYLAAYDPESGVVLKLAGDVKPDPETGRLTVTFPETPQIPFENLKLSFTEGPRAALANPRACGSYSPEFSFTPWSAALPAQASEVDHLSPSFQISGECSVESTFAPTIASGTTTNEAGRPSPFTMSFTRSTAEQQLGRVTIVTPDLVGHLAGVTQCPEAQASAGSCPEASKIGYIEVAVGPGEDPLWEPEAGKPQAPIYLTGPYEGAPFGLSIPVPAEAGPLHLGKVLMRAKVNVDPHTAALTIESDEIPHILDGVPLQVRTFNVVINREGFVSNPTNCDALPLAARVESLKGALESREEHFQATGCESLPFAPAFSAQSEAKTSRQNGASLSVRISQRPGEANLKRIDIQVPEVMPTRLPTLQRSCPEAQFEANPAACPAESIVGHAKARTRVLAAPLEGPAILVSHAGLHLPDVVVVLQGEGVTIEAASETHIVKGVLHEDFETIPDNPVESFEVSLPAGPHSILAANSSLCKPTEVVVKTKRVALKRHGKVVRRNGRVVYRKRKVKQRVAAPLAMPTTIEGQNGHLVQQSVRISVSGCPKAKPAKRHGARRRKR